MPLLAAAWLAATLALQEPPAGTARVLLEDLAGNVDARALPEFRTRDPREQGAHFVRFAGVGSAAPAREGARARVELAGGRDHVEGWVTGGEGDLLRVALAAGVQVDVPIDWISALVFEGRLPHDAAREATDAAAGGDRLWRVRPGGVDRVDGLVAAFSTEGVRFESRLGERVYPWSEVAALRIEPLEPFPGEAGDPADPEPGGAEAVPVVVDLAGGGRLFGELREIGQGGVLLSVLGQRDLALPPATVTELAVVDGSFAFLSELEPSDRGPVSPTGDELGMTWPPRIDRARDGRPLVAGGRRFVRGIGVQAPSRITWTLDGSWRELRVFAAIDDQVLELPRHGSVVFRVHVDGELRWESPLVRGGDPVLEVPAVSLEGARELVLEVDPATDLWVADRADWLRPILVRARAGG